MKETNPQGWLKLMNKTLLIPLTVALIPMMSFSSSSFAKTSAAARLSERVAPETAPADVISNSLNASKEVIKDQVLTIPAVLPRQGAIRSTRFFAIPNRGALHPVNPIHF
jgi:hypothetical protein